MKIDSGILPKDLDAAFAMRATAMPQARLGAGSWQFEDDAKARKAPQQNNLREKYAWGKFVESQRLELRPVETMPL